MKNLLKYSFLAILALPFFIPSYSYAGGLTVPTNIKIDRIECVNYPRVSATISWDRVEFATSYRIYPRIATQSFDTYDEVASNSYKLSINTEEDLRIAVTSINTFSSKYSTSEVLESDKSMELPLSGRDIKISCPEKTLTPTITETYLSIPDTESRIAPFVKIRPTSTPLPENTFKAEDIEMSEYAASLSAQDNRPTTEEMIGSIVRWITDRLPFFK